MTVQGPAGLGAVRDYQIVLPPPTITMPQLAAGADVTQAQADAANAVGDSAAELIGLDIAIATARLRAQQAGQAGDLTWLSRQTDAYQELPEVEGRRAPAISVADRCLVHRHSGRRASPMSS